MSIKKLFLFLPIFLFGMTTYAQIAFENGYFIKDNNEKVECLIKNVDWRNTPTDFEYKFSDTAESKKTGIDFVREFGIGMTAKYIRAVVQIDRSSEDLSMLSPERNPLFREETLFLKVLVEGPASLFIFEQKNLTRFFYQINDTEIKQLVYKLYSVDTKHVATNYQFRQQLYTDLKCHNVSRNTIETLRYYENELVRLFVRYNECQNADFINFDENQKRDYFNLNVRPGLNISSLSIQNSITEAEDADFGTDLSLRTGLECEFIFPFNKSKWALLLEPTFQYFKSQTEAPSQAVEVNYNSIEIPVSIRHYFFLKEKSKIFMNAGFVMDVIVNSTIKYEFGWEMDLSRSGNFALGFGYKYNDRFSLEMRYLTSRNFLTNYSYWTSDYKTLSLIFGYSIF